VTAGDERFDRSTSCSPLSSHRATWRGTLPALQQYAVFVLGVAAALRARWPITRAAWRYLFSELSHVDWQDEPDGVLQGLLASQSRFSVFSLLPSTGGVGTPSLSTVGVGGGMGLTSPDALVWCSLGPKCCGSADSLETSPSKIPSVSITPRTARRTRPVGSRRRPQASTRRIWRPRRPRRGLDRRPTSRRAS